MTSSIPTIDFYITILLFTGSNVEEAKKIIEESKLPIISAEGFEDAGRKAVASALLYKKQN